MKKISKIFMPVFIFLLVLVFVSVAPYPVISQEPPIFAKNHGPYYVGERGPAGGWIIYDKGNDSDGWRYMEAAPEDQTPDSWRHKGLVRWGCKQATPGARYTAIGTGMLNTKAMLEKCDEPKIAARLCADYRGGDKDDWFLPSKDELNLIYVNLVQNNIGGLRGGEYWSSSETTNGRHAWQHNFSSGLQLYAGKHPKYRVRAVRVFKDEKAGTSSRPGIR
ncbi:MAG: DUF1566 domain-containing protein [Desulfatiglans sp.]|nr:DUF1566 domain-containing protein [Desulfatiglans sp.]